MSKLVVNIPDKLIPVFDADADTRGSYGGRGSAKTRTFAKMTAVRAMRFAKAGREGIILCGRQFMNSLEDSSLEEVKAAIRSEPLLEPHFEIGENFVRTRDGRVSYSFVGLARNINSVKSKSRILIAWIDEAEDVTENAWSVLIPTIREDGSELWVTWNPKSKSSATHKRFRENANPSMKIVEMNWRDNPWFPDRLNRTRLDDLEKRPDSYDWIWEGGFIQALEGAYYSKQLRKAREEGRIGRVAADPLHTIRLVCDIGGTGAKADAFVIWAVQFIGKQICFINHYEAQGQTISDHLHWCRSQGYDPGRAQFVLPHDGGTHDKVYRVSYESALREAGYHVTVIPNQLAGAAAARIEEARILFPRMWFDEDKCSAGLDAIGWYHEKRDEVRGVGMGPNHDWSSHSADAFGAVAVIYDEPRTKTASPAKKYTSNHGWMG